MTGDVAFAPLLGVGRISNLRRSALIYQYKPQHSADFPMHQVSKQRPALPALRPSSRRDRRAARSPATVRHLVTPGLEVARAEARPRETVTAFLRRTGWATRDREHGWQFRKGLPTILEINGEAVLRRDWRRRRIGVRAEVRFVSYPLGGNGGAEQILGLVSLIAFAFWAGPIVAGAFGFGGSALVGGLATGGRADGQSGRKDHRGVEVGQTADRRRSFSSSNCHHGRPGWGRLAFRCREGRDGGPSTKENCAPRGNNTVVAVHLSQEPTELEFPSSLNEPSYAGNCPRRAPVHRHAEYLCKGWPLGDAVDRKSVADDRDDRGPLSSSDHFDPLYYPAKKIGRANGSNIFDAGSKPRVKNCEATS
jgi:hypothetical protein